MNLRNAKPAMHVNKKILLDKGCDEPLFIYSKFVGLTI